MSAPTAEPQTQFHRGDVVRLKSGGPKMTVFGDSWGYKRNVECEWFNGNERCKDDFHVDVLEAAQ